MLTRHRLLPAAASLIVAAALGCTALSGPVAAASVRTSQHVQVPRSSARPVQIAAGHADGCELELVGAARCWGSNAYGQLGDGTTRASLLPVDVRGLTGVRQIATGFGHTCALLQSRTVQCWGWNRYGQLGNGRTTNTTVHVGVRALSGVRSIALGFEHSCALLASERVKCWGWNYYGQLGTGTRTNSSLPVIVRGLRNVVQIAAGYGHSCALLRTGTVKCWGLNQNGQLGNGTTRTEPVPVVVNGLAGAVGISAGFGHSCAILHTGAVRCWGLNQDGQLGDGERRIEHAPVAVRGLSGVTQLALGYGHSCALLRTKTIKCWGWNQDGQLGTGTWQSSLLPLDVRLTGVIQLVAGDDSTCALLDLGLFSCWGSNVDGQLGDGSRVSTSIPPFTPAAPTNVTAVARPSAAVVRWHASRNVGLGSVKRYAVTSHPGKLGCVTSRLSCTVPGLSNGVGYIFTVTATNLAGIGLASSPSAMVIPATIPTKPTTVTAARGNATALVKWHAPSSNGGARILSYTATAADLTTPANGHETCSWTTGALQCTVAGLTNGDSYTFTVLATNVAGSSPDSTPSSAVIPADVPSTPTSVSAVAGNTTALVSWSAPTSNGGATIVGYTVTAADLTAPANGNEHCAWTTGALQCTVAGLTNGDSYTFTVSATNGAGMGPTSSASSAVVPATVPGKPTSVSAVAGNTTALVSWSAPGSNGGSTILGYTVTAADLTVPANGNETCSWTTGPLTCIVVGLTNGDSYTFTVTATNRVGTGTASSASSAVVPATVPGKPTSVSAVAGNTTALVSWSAPASNGGSTIVGYTVTAADLTAPVNGNEHCTWTTGALQCTVAGLTNGDSYTFTVTATNGAGTGLASSASSAVVPSSVPGKPTGVSATPGDTSALVSWSAPASDGGSTITGYTVTAADSTTPVNGNETCSWTTGPLSCTVAGLTNGDSYTFTVTATNGTGTGPASQPSAAVVPATTPGQPTSVSATPGDTSALVTWSAPASDGGSAITGYTVTAADSTTPANGNETCSLTTGPLSCTVSGLTNGDSYTFTVTATNSAGTGSPSSPSLAVVPATTPGPPTAVAATPGIASAIVTWSAPASDGGSAITGYTVTSADSTTPANGNETCSWITGPLTCIVVGLTTGDSYTFTVTATNSAGTGNPSSSSSPIDAARVHLLTGGSYGFNAPSAFAPVGGDILTWIKTLSGG